MPTGYTEIISRKDLTFNEFALRCSRAFGALVMMRDDDMDVTIPDRFVPSDYHFKALSEAEAHLAAVESLSDEQAENEARQEYEAEAKRVAKSNQESRDLRAKYESMLAKVEEWAPPTPEHFGLKEFMIKQIKDSIEFDCHESEAPKRATGDAWRKKMIGRLTRDVEYHREEHQKEIERTASRNKWIADLRASL